MMNLKISLPFVMISFFITASISMDPDNFIDEYPQQIQQSATLTMEEGRECFYENGELISRILSEMSDMKASIENFENKFQILSSKLDETNARQDHCEKFIMQTHLTATDTKYHRFLSYDMTMNVSVGIALLGTMAYYYNPTLITPFVFFYLFSYVYSSLKVFQTMGTGLAQIGPMKRATDKQ